MRLLLAILLCLAIPFQGIASARTVEPPCPMAQAAIEVASDDHGRHAGAAAAHDCCNDEDAVAKTGKLCKTGQECKVGQAAALAAPVRLAPDTAPIWVLPTSPSGLLSFHPPGVWRPPALV